jgi:Fic family protein
MVLQKLDAFQPKGATAEIVADVDAAITEISRDQPLSEHLAQQLTEGLLYDRIYSSAVTEGNRLSRRETIAVLSTGLIEAGSRKDVTEIRNLGEAILLLEGFVRDHVELSEGAVRELHRTLLQGMDSYGPGVFRTDEVAIAGSSTPVPSAGDVPALVRQVSEVVGANLNTAHPVVLAAWAHWAITRIHPFRDGNGRLARLVQDYVLLRRHYLPAPLFAEDREGQYYDALQAADEGDTKGFVELLSKNVLRIADRYLTAIREVSQKERWLDAITRAASEKVRETEHRRFMIWERRMSALRVEFRELATELTERIPELWVGIRDYGGIDFDKFKTLRARGPAKRTWLFGLQFRHEEANLRFVFWAAKHYRRAWDPEELLTDDPVLLCSIEEQQKTREDQGVYYRSLDDLDEPMISLREVVPFGDGFARRRYNPASSEYQWDLSLSAGQIARDFYTEVMQKLLVA